MSNSEPSAIVLQGIPCMCGLYKFRFEWRKRFAQGSPRFTLSWIAHEVSNWRGIARRESGLRDRTVSQTACSRHEARMAPAKRRRHPQNSAILVALRGELGWLEARLLGSRTRIHGKSAPRRGQTVQAEKARCSGISRGARTFVVGRSCRTANYAAAYFLVSGLELESWPSLRATSLHGLAGCDEVEAPDRWNILISPHVLPVLGGCCLGRPVAPQPILN